MNTSIYNILVKKANGEEIMLSQYRWKVLLVVNTATECGLAPQLRELEVLWNTYSHDEFVILGFPCGQFLNQEPGNDEEIQEVCQLNFWVTFPVFAKIDVNGISTHPLYQYLRWEKWGLFGDIIKWNYTKFLINREWNVVDRYAPTTSPLSMKWDIEKLISW